jgi:TPR repeat protein
VVFRIQFASVAVALWALAFIAIANAGPFEDAEAIANKGDYTTAFRLFRTLADQGNTYAQRRLGIMYLRGQGVPRDFAEALKWIRIAADKGLADAQSDVAIFYQRGWGVEQNGAEAVKWLRLAAGQGSVVFENNLADTYATGRGVPQNFAEALKWYRLAADQSSSYAENVIGMAYERGISVAQDYSEAFRWYRRAANKIYERPDNTWIHSPQYNFAALYASGHGTAQDYVQAFMWFTLAAALGDTKTPDEFGVNLLGTPKLTALEQRDKLSALMTSAQIAEAERLAREWSPHPIVTIEPKAK